MHSGDSKGFVSRRRSSSYICIASSVGENSDFFFFSTSFLSGTVTLRPHTLSPRQGSLTELSDWIVLKGVLQNRCLHVHNLSRRRLLLHIAVIARDLTLSSLSGGLGRGCLQGMLRQLFGFLNRFKVLGGLGVDSASPFCRNTRQWRHTIGQPLAYWYPCPLDP
jgi:hypothetical protein